MKFPRRNIFSKITGAAVAAALAISFASCDSVIYDDLEPCDEGLRLRFVYDYNMEFANAFPSQVHCLTLLVYDKDGKYLQTRTVTDSELLSDEDWRMTIDLPAGSYRLIAYGGMEEPEASFAFDPLPGADVPMTDVDVFLKPGCITKPVGTDLHDLFFGELDVTVPAESVDYTDATVEMMKDTNNIKIILQNTDGSPVDNEDYNFVVTADNTLFDYRNNIIPTTTTEFYPWTRGQQSVGVIPNPDNTVDDIPAEVAFAEISLSRLIAGAGQRLEITRKDDNSKVISIPLVNYLLLFKSERYAEMGAQEFLDRESRWTMFFFLQNGYWLSSQIVVNGWVVRINNIQT